MFGYGRGGKNENGRSNRFVFCLLDWASGRRTIDGGMVSRRDIMVDYDGDAPLRIMNDDWLQFVYTNALRLEEDQRVQHLLRNEPEQQQLALARENRLMEEENLVNM